MLFILLNIMSNHVRWSYFSHLRSFKLNINNPDSFVHQGYFLSMIFVEPQTIFQSYR